MPYKTGDTNILSIYKKIRNRCQPQVVTSFSFPYVNFSSEEVDMELLMKALANPEIRALLNSLAKTMK